MDKVIKQCCRPGTGTAGIVTFCLSGTGTRMHYSSGSGSNIKCHRKVKIKKEANCLENNAASDIEKARFDTDFFLRNCAKYCLDLEPEPKPKPEPK